MFLKLNNVWRKKINIIQQIDIIVLLWMLLQMKGYSYCFDNLEVNIKDIQLDRVFQERITKVDDLIEVNWKCVRDSLRSVIPILVDKVNQIPLKIN